MLIFCYGDAMKINAILQCITVALLMVFISGSAAVAVTVTNLDTSKHHLRVEAWGGEAVHKVLLPGETVRLPSGRMTLILLLKSGNKKLEAQELNQYVIWPGGELKLQRRIRTGARGGGLR